MMTLEQLNYKLEGEAFVKHIDNYKITLFPSDRGYIRRIIKDNRVIDMKKGIYRKLRSRQGLHGYFAQ